MLLYNFKQEQENNEAIISFRGKPRYIMLDFKKYDRLRALELDEAYLETMKEIKKGRYKTLTTDEHIKEHLESL